MVKMNRISISDLKGEDTLSLLKKDEKSSVISAAVDRSLNARKISGGYSSLCGGRREEV
jgi:hypothetical protein